MALKLSGHLFYGPMVLEKVKIRKNQLPAVFAVVLKSGEPWDPVFRLADADWTGEEGLVLSEHPRAATWRTLEGGALQIYLFDLDGERSGAAALAHKIIDDVKAAYPDLGEINY